MTRRFWIVSAALALAAVAAVTTVAASSAGGWFGHPGRWGHGFGHGGPGFGHHGHDPEHIRRGLRWVLGDVDATDEQVDAITEIAVAATEDFHSLREQHRSHREAVVAALGGDEVDREALEQLRAEGLALAETASARFVTAVADAADVLTPEQRRELIEAHDRHRHGRRHGWHR